MPHYISNDGKGIESAMGREGSVYGDILAG